MVRRLNPEAKVVSDKTLRADAIQEHLQMMEELKRELREVPGKISITMDGWTSMNVLPFVAIRGHWLTHDWEYKSKLLDFATIEGSHSGLNLRNVLVKCLDRLGVPFEKILGITVDNATNNDTLLFWLQEFGLSAECNQIRCFAHIMNLAVQDILKALKIKLPDPLGVESTQDNHAEEEEEDELENEVRSEAFSNFFDQKLYSCFSLFIAVVYIQIFVFYYTNTI